jgi:hypothetical protein
VRLALALLVGLAGCATLAKDQTVCPEYRDLRCPAGPSCSLDQARGCRVCQCNPINTMGPVSGPDQNVPPPVVVPQH